MDNQNNELKKHVAIIHCMNTLSLLQRKISNALLYHAYPELQTQEEHEISIKQLCNIIGYSGNNHAVIKTALKGLIATVIEWDIIDNATGEEDWTASTILASVRLKGSLCTYAYSPRMKALLYSPSMYGKINLYIQARFKSSYGLALYENCIRYRGLPSTRWFDLPVFRKLMGVPENMYPIFRDLKRRVLDKSIEEVNTYSDIRVESEIERVGHKVISIRFILKNTQPKNMPGKNIVDFPDSYEDMQINNDNKSLIKKLSSQFGISYDQSLNLLDDYGHEYIQNMIHLVESSSSYQSGKINNLAAYLIKAIKENYQPPQTSKKHFQLQLIENNQQILNEKNRLNEEWQLRKDYSIYVNDFIVNALENMIDNKKDSLLADFEKSLVEEGRGIMIARYKKDGLKSTIVMGLFKEFLARLYPEFTQSIQTYEQYVDRS